MAFSVGEGWGGGGGDGVREVGDEITRPGEVVLTRVEEREECGVGVEELLRVRERLGTGGNEAPLGARQLVEGAEVLDAPADVACSEARWKAASFTSSNASGTSLAAGDVTCA